MHLDIAADLRDPARVYVSSGPTVAVASGMAFDERSWLGDPAAEARRKNVRTSESARVAALQWVRPFPMAAVKILALTSGEAFDVPKIVAAVESDVALATRVLRVVNSSGFGLRNGCASIHQAVPLLGSSGIRRATIASSVLNLFPGNGSQDWRDLHAHAALVGGLARHLAPEWCVPADAMFTTAFLHDIGRWVLLDTVPEYTDILALAHHQTDAALDEERGRFGFDHAELAEAVLLAWQIPRPLARLAGLHHDPANGYTESRDVAVRVALLRAADQLAHFIAKKTTPDFDTLGRGEPFSYLGLSADQLRDRFDALTVLFRDGTDADEGSAAKGPSPRVASPTPTVRTHEACAFCDGPAFGARCVTCDARLCGDHVGYRGACPDCELERSRGRSRQKVGQERAALVVGPLVLGVAGSLVAATLKYGPWAAAPLAVAIVAVAFVVSSMRESSAQGK